MNRWLEFNYVYIDLDIKFLEFNHKLSKIRNSPFYGSNRIILVRGSIRKIIPDVSRSFWYVQFSLSWKLKFHHFFIIFHIHVHFFDFFINFIFFIFRLVLGIWNSQIQFLGLISCPGLLPNRSGLKFCIYSNFRVHMVFMCRPCVIEISIAIHILELEPN